MASELPGADELRTEVREWLRDNWVPLPGNTDPWASSPERIAWLEKVLDGVVLHYFMHAEPAGAAAWQLPKMNLPAMNHRRRVAGKEMAFEIKQKLEAGRPVGVSRLA